MPLESNIFTNLATLAQHIAWPSTLAFIFCSTRREIKHLAKAFSSRISDSRNDIAISKDGIEIKLAKLQERTEKVESTLEQNDQQNRLNLVALEHVDIQLSETIEPQFSPQDLINAILKASPLALELIYQKTREVRHSAWSGHKRRLIERTIPIFQALVKSQHGSRKPRYYAQLAYALKDQEKPDWQAAKDNLERAIYLWQKEDKDKPISPFYCFNWVICAVQLDDFSNCNCLQKSAPEIRDAIIKKIDLVSLSGCSSLVKALRENEVLQNWLNRNNYSFDSTISDGQNGDCRNETYLLEAV